MAVPCVPDVPQVFKFFEKIFGKWDIGHMKNHIMAVPHVPKSSKFLKFFFLHEKICFLLKKKKNEWEPVWDSSRGNMDFKKQFSLQTR